MAADEVRDFAKKRIKAFPLHGVEMRARDKGKKQDKNIKQAWQNLKRLQEAL